MGERDLKAALALMFKRICGDDLLELNAETTLTEEIGGWDSFKFVELILEAQERFGIELGARQIERIRTFGDLVEAVAAARRG